MKLTMLGTGYALATECYNTCFVLSENNKYFLVDGGGGNTLLNQLKKVNINWKDIRDIFVTHKHIDHVMGIIWMVRLICQHMAKGDYEGEARIYAHEELINIIKDISETLLQKKQTDFIGKRLRLIPVHDGSDYNIIGHKITFFDIHSTKAKQYGFTMDIENGEKFTCCGDEPYNDAEKYYVSCSKWLMHEAFCLFSEKDKFNPYEKHHSTVKDACEMAQRLNVKNLVLYHTEDKNILKRKELYIAEGKKFYFGNLYVPDDLEQIEI
ncbi:MBL fold metallo-hydrolase [Clostridium sp. BJN0001]|uniref:MBL fold metallo-hydrolase n=1 Tax=Clostridium sp. BJN0001 TaxID=2930219 RepID=UPI001FD10C3C|nr:MBL fold metallo-hydrolase [Clostridium sp. BJN0001]